jgi:hypothetical protein
MINFKVLTVCHFHTKRYFCETRARNIVAKKYEKYFKYNYFVKKITDHNTDVLVLLLQHCLSFKWTCPSFSLDYSSLSGKVLKHVLIKYGTAQTINRRDGCSG